MVFPTINSSATGGESSTATTDFQNKQGNQTGFSTGAIAGVAIASAVGAILIGVLLFCVWSNMKHKHRVLEESIVSRGESQKLSTVESKGMEKRTMDLAELDSHTVDRAEMWTIANIPELDSR